MTSKKAEIAKKKKAPNKTVANIPKTHKEISSYISSLAEYFVEINDDIDEAKDFKGKWDYSIDSIRLLDEFVDHIWEGNGPSKSSRNQISLIFGGYVAEVLQRSVTGEWSISKDGEYSFTTNDFAVLYPWSWTTKMLVDGDPIDYKFQMALKLSGSKT